MQTHTAKRTRLQLATGALAVLFTACMASPPQAAVKALSGTVRASSTLEATEIAKVVDELRPRIAKLLPDAGEGENVEVWLQDQPSLYAFPTEAASEAEGLWSERHGRILLARGADDPIRTLAHELTHAALGPSWDVLPGTMEEGLCDVMAGHLVPSGTLRLRTGRMASAALAAGGLRLRFELWPANTRAEEVDLTSEQRGQAVDSTRLMLRGRDSEPFDPMLVFDVQAGLSTTTLPAGSKRNFYGLAYLVVAGVVERHGLEGLHRLCLDAAERDLAEIPAHWFLAAAELGPSSQEWRSRAAEGFGPLETKELLSMYASVTEDGARELLDRAKSRGLEPREYEVWGMVEGSGRAVRVRPRDGARFGRPIEANWR